MTKMEINDLTPIQEYPPLNIWLKRDDLYTVAGVRGAKARACYALALKGKKHGEHRIVTAGSRHSPQMVIAAHIARELGMQCSVHIPQGPDTEESKEASAEGAELIRHPHGYNSVIIARAREDVQKNGGAEIPFGMVSKAGVELTAAQVDNAQIPDGVQRIVIAVGSATNLCGLLWGCRRQAIHLPILGVVVGARPEKRLKQFAPPWWEKQVTLVNSGVDYAEKVDAHIGNLPLDPVYEAKCLKFLRLGDLFWIIGIRNGYNVPEW